MIDDLEGPVTVISPHLDDAVLSTWSVLRTGLDVRVVVVFAGIPPTGTTGEFDPIFATADSAGLVRDRRLEDRAALAHAGRVPVHLELLDVQYRTHPLAVDEVGQMLEPVIGEEGTVLVPAGIGRHPDHLLARDAALEIARRRALPVHLYAEQPYATNMGWPSWVTGAPAQAHLVPDAAWRRSLAEVADPSTLVPVVGRLDADEQAARLAALRCYESQFAALEGGPHRRLSLPAVAGCEVRWIVPG